MKINQFMSAHLDNMVRQNRYEVELFGPPNSNIRSRGMRCTNISLPGKQIVFAETTEYGGGPMRKHANKVDYGGGLATMTFLCDHTFEDKQLVELWQSKIYDEGYGYQYPEDYCGEVIIRQLGMDGLPVYEVKLHDAWPQQITEQTLDSTSSEIQSFVCGFAFRSWSSSFENSPSGLLGGLFKKYKRKITTKVNRKLDEELFGN
tara:strand:- start:122 stop:733 length:612 start_codon:yes stop_codon:yes gene_type:complete